MYDFHSILTAHGFNRESYDFESTIVGFDYDVQFSLFAKTVFDIDQSRMYRQWDNLNALLRCELVACNGDVQAAVRFFHHRWITELRYQNPVREIIDVQQRDQSASIHVLTISKHNAMTLLFNIT